MNHNTIMRGAQRRTMIGSVGTMTIALLATVGLAACGGGDGGGAAELGAVAEAASPVSPLDGDDAVDVCALITTDELSAAFGEAYGVGELTHHDQMGGDQCIWSVTDPMSIGMVSLTVQRDADLPDELHDNGMDAERLFDETRRTMYADGVDLALGEKGYGSGSTVHVFYDDAIFDFMTLGDTPEDVAAIQALASSTIEALMA
jgi:hypothetical protein